MRVFVAGTTGAVGRPLVAQLVEAGHEVVGTTRSEERADDLRTRWVEPVVVDALDADALALGGPTPPGMSVPEALKAAGPELVHYHTTMPGASNARAKAALGWQQIWPDWRRGFEQELGDLSARPSS